jgi:hypothetical protein
VDPNANLREQDECRGRTGYDPPMRRLEALRIALADWLRSGGFAPDWHAYPDAAREFAEWDHRRRRHAEIRRAERGHHRSR